MTTLARVLAVVLGVGLLAGLIILGVAGLTAAVGALLTVVAVVAMIALGGLLGGRNTPGRAPRPVHPESGPDPEAETTQK